MKTEVCPICGHWGIVGWYGKKFKVCFDCYFTGKLQKYLCKEHDTLYSLCGCKTKKEIEKDD